MAVIAYWPLSGDNPLNDYSGNNYHLTNSGCLIKTDGIKKNSYLSPEDGNINILYINNLPSIQSKTVSFYLKKIGDLTNLSYILFHGATSKLTIRIYNNGFRIYVVGITNGYFEVSGSLINLELNHWLRFDIKYDFISNNIYVYREGELVFTYTSATQLSHQVSSGTLNILGSTVTNYLLKNCLICELTITEELISATEIKNQYLKMKGFLYA